MHERIVSNEGNDLTHTKNQPPMPRPWQVENVLGNDPLKSHHPTNDHTKTKPYPLLLPHIYNVCKLGPSLMNFYRYVTPTISVQTTTL